MKKYWLLLGLLWITGSVQARVIVVDPNGDVPTITLAINMATPGDTVKILPGIYEEQIELDKDIIVMGSGYENTILTGPFDPVVNMTAGVLQWVRITSLSGSGVFLKGGVLRNVVIQNCAKNGVYMESADADILNSVIVYNGWHGIWLQDESTVNVINSIVRDNGRRDIDSPGLGGVGRIFLSHVFAGSWRVGQGSAINTFNKDPQFRGRYDFRLSGNSPAIDAGNPSILDPDGSISDIGYFGGPHAPTFPVVTRLELIPLEDGGVRVKAYGRANF